MTISISKAAQLYFALNELSDKEMSFTAAYRLKRNLDKLKVIGEKYSADLQKEFAELKDGLKADQAVFRKWEASGETDEFDLKEIDFSKEDLKLTVRQITFLEPILILES